MDDSIITTPRAEGPMRNSLTQLEICTLMSSLMETYLMTKSSKKRVTWTMISLTTMDIPMLDTVQPYQLATCKTITSLKVLISKFQEWKETNHLETRQIISKLNQPLYEYSEHILILFK